MGRDKNLYIFSLQFQKQIYDNTNIQRIYIRFRLIPKKNRAFFQSAVFNQLPQKCHFSDSFGNKIEFLFRITAFQIKLILFFIIHNSNISS